MEWIRKAREFLEVAREDLDKERYWLACFHSQQAVELYLKGVLVKYSGSYPFTHSIVELLEALEALGVKVDKELYVYADALERHYTRARYPGVGLVVYNERTGARCLEYAEKIISFAREVLEGEEEAA